MLGKLNVLPNDAKKHVVKGTTDLNANPVIQMSFTKGITSSRPELHIYTYNLAGLLESLTAASFNDEKEMKLIRSHFIRLCNW